MDCDQHCTASYLALVVVHIVGHGSLHGIEHATSRVQVALQLRLGRLQLVGLFLVMLQVVLEELGTSLVLFGLLQGLVALGSGVQAVGAKFGLDELDR